MVVKNCLSALVLAAAYFGVATVNAQACARNYTVQPGDICNSICAAQNVSTFQLMSVNPEIDAACDNLFVGENLCLGLVGQDCDTVHVVMANDTCISIAAQANISFSDVLTDNPNVNAQCTNILVDEVLCVAPVNSTSS